MTPAEFKSAVITISGSVKQFAKDYAIPYRTIEDWCYKKPSAAGIALVREILKKKL